MRHAKSSWKYPDLSDHERPLKKRGRKASVKIAKELIKLNWIPDKLYSSDSERTRETWKKMKNVEKDEGFERHSINPSLRKNTKTYSSFFFCLLGW